ncbi:MAG: hypothetical protein IH999_02980 [Proteobacteria bacterium]|nr:hypothetical protein [Pseudomonadota bacterium]
MPQVKVDPFPYFVLENVIDPATLDAMLEHWPDDNFVPDIPGQYFCDLKGPVVADELREFWRGIRDGLVNDIAGILMRNFAPWIEARYPHGPEMTPQRIWLMQSDPGFLGHNVHTHHYHAPNWCGTIVLFLDEDAGGHHGTSVHRHAVTDLDSQAKLAAGRRWQGHPEIELAEHVAYKQNRLLAFFDCPIAYHSVPPAPDSTSRRRIFRMHLAMPNSEIERIYGVTQEDYYALRMQYQDDPPTYVVEWMKRDIQEVRSVTPALLSETQPRS